MSTVALALRVLLVVVLGWSAIGKLTTNGRRGLADLLDQLGMGRRAGLVGGLLVAAEAGAAVLLLLPWTVVVGAVLASAVLAVLTAGVVVILRRRLKVTCACFGASGSTIAPMHAGRNGALLLAAVATSWLAPHPPNDLTTAIVAVGAGGLLAVVVTRLDDFAFLLSPR